MKNFKNILLINYGGIGDEILFLPTIDAIKKEYNDAKITLALEPRSKSIQNLSKNIDEIIWNFYCWILIFIIYKRFN